MFDLFGTYLLIIILLFAGTTGLYTSELKLSKGKYLLLSILLALAIGIITFFSGSLNLNYPLRDNLGWVFIIVAIILFILNYLNSIRKSYFNAIYILTIAVFLVTIFLILLQENERWHISIFLAALFFIIMVVLMPVSDLLHYAKREFGIIVGEFNSLEAILIFILGITFWSLLDLDYGMFSSYLILTPTYQLVYIAIAIVVIFIIGLYYNDRKLKKR